MLLKQFLWITAPGLPEADFDGCLIGHASQNVIAI
jgi:hypothetical protein